MSAACLAHEQLERVDHDGATGPQSKAFADPLGVQQQGPGKRDRHTLTHT